MSRDHTLTGVRRSLSPGVLLGITSVIVMLIGLGGCSRSVTDANEPNDDPASATELASGTAVAGVTGSGDSDVFSSTAPTGDGEHPFVIRVTAASPHDLDVQVGASIPGVWEGISWPGWEAVTAAEGLVVRGQLRQGTVLVFVKGTQGTEYAVEIRWESPPSAAGSSAAS